MDAVFTSFLPTSSVHDRANGYRVLAELVNGQPGSLIEPARSLLDVAFRSASASDALAGLTFLTALFQADSVSASALFLDEGIAESVSECVDLYSSAPDVRTAVVSLLSQAAAGNKECREIIAERYLTLLESSSQQTANVSLRTASVCTLTKLFSGARQNDKSDPRVRDEQLDALVGLIRHTTLAVLTDPLTPGGSAADVVEALAYISTQPAAKDAFASDDQLLKQVFSLIPKRNPSAELSVSQQPALYGIAVFLRNLSAYRPQRTAEEEQIAKLRGMTREGSKLSSDGRMTDQQPDDVHDEPTRVLARCNRLIAAGAVASLSAISRQARESERIGRVVGEAILYLIEEKSGRGKALADGAAATLLAITRTAFTKVSKDETTARTLINVDDADLLPAQALAKLSITASPMQVYGADSNTILNALRPLAALLFHPNATRLQNFEGLMALTNLASAGPAVAARIDALPGFPSRLESLLLDDHVLVRRAAAELTCNILTAVPAACERMVSAQNRMTVMLALSDVEDEPTRSAIAGALACIAHDPRAARAVLSKAENVARLITSEEDGLVHRGCVVVLGAFEGLQDDQEKTKAFARILDKEGVTTALVKIVKRGQAAVGPLFQPAAEGLKALAVAGVQITV